MKQRLGLWVLYYLRFLAQLQLKKFAPDIIGITGSAGKTSTRNAVAAILKDKYILKVTEKANSESGIPLDILDISPNNFSPLDWLRMLCLAPIHLATRWTPIEKYVVEMGIDRPLPPKNMDYLLTIVQPRTALFLNALPVHTEYFKNVSQIAREKGKLVRSLPSSGLAIVNLDDPLVMENSHHIQAQSMTFGKNPDATICISQIKPSFDGTLFEFTHKGTNGRAKLPYLLADHYGYSLAAALCVALDEGFSLQEGCLLLEKNFRLPPGRMSVFPGLNGSTIIDSSYNSSPAPTIDALLLVASLPAKRRIALLGDMRELGPTTKTEHLKVIEVALKHMDHIYMVGPLMKQYCLPISQKTKKTVKWFPTAQQAGQALQHILEKGDVLLAKGSQNSIFLETALEFLLKDPDYALPLLCRRGDYWDIIRKKYV